jgi:hypothetical protein
MIRKMMKKTNQAYFSHTRMNLSPMKLTAKLTQAIMTIPTAIERLPLDTACKARPPVMHPTAAYDIAN